MAAERIVSAGFRTIASLRSPAGLGQLNEQQKIGLQYHEELKQVQSLRPPPPLQTAPPCRDIAPCRHIVDTL